MCVCVCVSMCVCVFHFLPVVFNQIYRKTMTVTEKKIENFKREIEKYWNDFDSSHFSSTPLR